MDGLGAAADVLRERVASGRAVLGICLGAQIALDESEEDGGTPGLGLVPGRAVRLRDERVPRIGWAPVEPSGETYWFAHSYACETDAVGRAQRGPRGDRRVGLVHRRAVPPGEERRAGARFLESCLSRA